MDGELPLPLSYVSTPKEKKTKGELQTLKLQRKKKKKKTNKFAHPILFAKKGKNRGVLK